MLFIYGNCAELMKDPSGCESVQVMRRGNSFEFSNRAPYIEIGSAGSIQHWWLCMGVNGFPNPLLLMGILNEKFYAQIILFLQYLPQIFPNCT